MATPISFTARSIIATSAANDPPAVMKSLGATMMRAGRRFASSLPALFGVLVFTFLLMRVLPGEPAVFVTTGQNAGKEEIALIRKQRGLNKPVPEQLLLYLYDVG